MTKQTIGSQTESQEEYDIPSESTCLKLLHQYGTPKHVVNHCCAVRDTAVQIAKALNQNGCDLDLAILESAALLHDIARLSDDHGRVGAELAEANGYFRIAPLIRRHMFYATDPDCKRIGEQDILCLADRCVKEDEYVGIDVRMGYVLEKFKSDPIATERITRKLLENRKLMDRIERLIHCTIDDLMKQPKESE